MSPQVGFDEFVRTRGGDLRRLAYLLTFDAAEADELVDRALAGCLARWPRLEAADDPYDVARSLLAGAAGRRRVRPAARRARGDRDLDAAAREQILAGLPALTPSQRRVAVLRFVEDLPEADAAEALGRSVRTVRAETNAALARLDAVAAGPGSDVAGRADRARRRLRRFRLRRATAATIVAAFAVAGAFTLYTPQKAAPAAALATPTTSPSARPLLFTLPPADGIPAARPGGFALGRGRTAGTYSKLWLYDADTAKGVRAIGELDGRSVRVGAAAVDPGPRTRVVFVRMWDITSACAPSCSGGAADRRPEQHMVWRLYELDPATGAERALTDVTPGEGPTQLAFSASGRRLALSSGHEVRVVDADSPAAAGTVVTFATLNPAPVLGFAGDDGPLLIWETETQSVTMWATRQWVTAIDIADPTRRAMVYDSFEADCEPAPSLWLASSGQLLLETTCGSPARGEVNATHLYAASGTDVRLVETSTHPDGYYEDLALDSSRTVFLRHLGPRPRCGGTPVGYRLSLDGRQQQVLGAGSPRCVEK